MLTRVASQATGEVAWSDPSADSYCRTLVDRESWTRQLQPLYRQLVKLNRQVARGNHTVPNLVAEKQAAIEDFDAAYGAALRFVKAAFIMVSFGSTLIKNLKP